MTPLTIKGNITVDKKNYSIMERCIKANLSEEPLLVNSMIRTSKGLIYEFTRSKTGGGMIMDRVGPEIPVTPMLKTRFETTLQFQEWSITLKNNGTWFWSWENTIGD